MAATTVGRVRSRMGSTTRNRLQANQAQNSRVALPSTTGPAPKSHWNHSPGSGTQGRWTRRLPACQALRATATARRVVRSEPT
jgi:hypothetical protein